MNDNRRKLTGILKLLYENTDAEHSMDTYQIMDALESMGHGRPDRKTIDANIRFIIEDLGFGIIKEKGKPNRYRWLEREFDLRELEMLVDAVHSSKFIGSRKSREIIAKLKDLTSVHQAARLNRDFHACDRHTVDRTDSLDTYNIINESIKSKLKVSFQIACCNIDKHELLKENGRTFVVSPYALLWSDDNCYMIGKPISESALQHYRVDKIRNITQLHEHADPTPADFDLDNYTSRVFDMFNGEKREVELSCKGSTMDSLIDMFGKDFQVEQTGSDQFTAKVTVDTSPSFYSWIFRFNGDVSIISPASVKSEYNKMLMDQLR